MSKLPDCPKCQKQLVRVYPRRQIFKCDEHGKFKKVAKRKKRSNFDINNPDTWTHKCVECGGTMEYHNFKYHCMKCGNTLYV